MRRILILALLAAGPAVLGSCGSGSTNPDAAADMAMPPSDLAPGPLLAPCLDRPDELPRPPLSTLPCELIPPGF